MKTDYSQRIYAAMWFMLAGCVPVLFVVLYGLSHGNGLPIDRYLFLFILPPVLLAGIFGFLIGADILNPTKVKASRQAAVRGLLVAVLSWLTFTVVVSILAPFTEPFRVNPISWFIGMFLISALLVGWLILIVGIAAGWLLYKHKMSHQKQ